MSFEVVEARLPFSALLGDPTDHLLQTFVVEPTRAPLTIDPLADQTATPEDADVAGDGLVGQVERRGEVADGRFAPREPTDDRPPSLVAEGGEGRVEVSLGIGSGRHDGHPMYNEVLVQAID